jgi:hypothetical protein
LAVSGAVRARAVASASDSAGVPRRIPEVQEGEHVSKGTVFVAGDVGEIEGFLGFFASEFCPVVTKVYKKEVVVGAA